jgi:hypothetical protein
MDWERLWKGIERSTVVIGGVCAIVTTYYTVGLFYGWDKQEAAKIGGVTATPGGVPMTLPFPVLILGALAVLTLLTSWAMIGIRLSAKKSKKPELTNAEASRRLYVGQVHAGFARFEDDYCVELAIRGYNGTGETISIGQLRGSVRFGETIDGLGVEKDMLPEPALLVDRTNTSKIAPFSEIFLVLNQYVSKTTALRMKELFEAKHAVTFDLRSLVIPIRIAGRLEEIARLPTYSLSFTKAEGVTTNRIVYATFHSGGSGSITA